ncbi:MAG: hypothetical protein DLM68_07530, partial [Hyphomicrobiales bacterium]
QIFFEVPLASIDVSEPDDGVQRLQVMAPSGAAPFHGGGSNGFDSAKSRIDRRWGTLDVTMDSTHPDRGARQAFLFREKIPSPTVMKSSPRRLMFSGAGIKIG